MRLHLAKLDPRKLLLGLVLALLLTFASAPARAGHWVISYKCQGKGTSQHLAARTVWSWPPGLLPPFGGSGGGVPYIFDGGYDASGGSIVYTIPGHPGPDRPIYAFPPVTHPWSDSGGIRNYIQGDPTTYYSSFVGKSGGGAPGSPDRHFDNTAIWFLEPSTYGSYPPVGFDYPIPDISADTTDYPYSGVGNPACGFVWTSDEAGTVTPVLTWTPDSTTDTAPPPLSVTVLESSYTYAASDQYGDTGFRWLHTPLAASDGLGDPCVHVEVDASPDRPGGRAWSQGARLVSADTGGQAVVTLPAVSLSASGGGATDSHYTGEPMPPVEVNLSVQVFDPVSVWSTADVNNPVTAVMRDASGSDAQWVSGTACVVWAAADPSYLNGREFVAPGETLAPPPVYVRSATLRINDQIVRSYPEDYRPSSTDTGVELEVMFDSTHFPNDTPIKIEVECHDSLGRSYKTHRTFRTYNKALVLGNQTFGDDAQNSVLAVESAASGVNYDVTHSFQDNVATILGELPRYTAFYIDSHGGVGNLTDCFGDGINEDDVFGQVQVSSALKAKSPTYPPYNFAMFDACIVMGDKFDNPDTSDDAGMSSAFDLAAGTDRAALGWDWFTDSSTQNEEWTKMLWSLLATGVPLRDAATPTSSEILEMGPALSIGGLQIGHTSINPVIQGDSNMTLHGVYGGTTYTSSPYFPLPIPVSTWFKPI